ncbi:uncharacterized protein Dvir_GJ26631, partial [Drosophila virilis]
MLADFLMFYNTIIDSVIQVLYWKLLELNISKYFSSLD